MEKEDMTFLPVSINITNKRILIIGGGRVGYHKALILSRFTDKITVISPVFHEGFEALPFKRIERAYEKKDLYGAFLVYACTENEQLNAQIKKDAEYLRVLVSVCDTPLLCDFISPAVFKEGNITIAVSSNGQEVRRSIDIRNQIEALVRDEKLVLRKENDTTPVD